MDRMKIHSLALVLLILALLPETESQRPRPLPIPMVPPLSPRPLCASQFSLVNYACAMLPLDLAPPLPPSSPLFPPSSPLFPPSSDDDEYESMHRHGHRHRRGHHHGGGHQETPAEENCCRWLKEVDSECVCDLLVHLPLFLSKPIHAYTVIVDDSCNVTFTCRGRLKP